MSMPGHSEMELSAVFTTSNAAYELTAPLEENLYDYISPMDMHQGNTAVKPPSLPKERESGYVISGLYDYQAASPKDIDDGYVIPSLEVPTNSNKGSPPFLSEDREDGYVIANLHQPLQTALLSQDSTNKATSDLSLPPAAQERENAVSELPTAAPQLQNSEKELRKKTHAMTDMHNLSPDDNLPHETTDDEIMSTTVSQLLNKEGKICDCSLEL